MVTRRHLLAGGVIGGMVGGGLPRPEESAAAVPAGTDQSDAAINSLRSVLEDIRTMWRNQYSCTSTLCPDIDAIRQEQRRFMKGSNKFPDFIDIGIDIWERLIDWHVKYQQRLAISRMADGRYSMPFFVTTLVLRPDMSGSYMSLGYDNK